MEKLPQEAGGSRINNCPRALRNEGPHKSLELKVVLVASQSGTSSRFPKLMPKSSISLLASLTGGLTFLFCYMAVTVPWGDWGRMPPTSYQDQFSKSSKFEEKMLEERGM